MRSTAAVPIFLVAVAAAATPLLPEGSSWRQSAQSAPRSHRIAPLHPVVPMPTETSSGASSMERMSMVNVTCHFFTQPLDHFSAPSGSRRTTNGETFEERYCIYDGYVEDSAAGPIFFYTGNESPVEQYVNQTGLMWELAPKHSALVVFAEHRYQGESVPDLQIWNDPDRLEHDGCFTHLTSSQALADYAALISHLDPTHQRPMILFGGSYGGMLSAWMRFLYPSSVAGAIAASAPIWGLPLTQESRHGETVFQSPGISGAAETIGRAVKLPYPPNVTNTDNGESTASTHSYCFDNLLATWPLISYFGKTELGKNLLKEVFRLCSPVKDEQDVTALLEWASSPFFDMAEGDFPYPSSYIPYSLNMGNNDLPAWPLQFACHTSGLDSDLGIRIDQGDEDVQFSIKYGSGSDEIILDIDWDSVVVQQNGVGPTSPAALKLLNATRSAISVWFNVSKTEKCFDAIPAINQQKKTPFDVQHIEDQHLRRTTAGGADPSKTNAEKCQDMLNSDTVWTALVCNEEMNQITTSARGMGGDFYWPPTYPRGIKSFKDTLTIDPDPLGGICADPEGIFGFPPRDQYDSWATWLDDYYGGIRILSRSNVVLSNGLLDPWSSAGVYKPNAYPSRERDSSGPVEVQNITAHGSVVALTMDLGGHHLDLMFRSDDDPPCAKLARDIEDEHITKWIAEWKEQSTTTCDE